MVKKKMAVYGRFRQSKVKNFLWCPIIVGNILDQFCGYFRQENSQIIFGKLN